MVYIDQRRERIMIEHTNDLPKYRCEYPDEAKRVAHYFNKPDFDCLNKSIHRKKRKSDSN